MPRIRPLTLIALVAAWPVLAEEGVSPGPGVDGVYAPDGMTCDSLGRIEVSGGSIVGAEFAITITDILELPGEPNTVEVSLLNQAGGGEWTESARLTIADQSLQFDYPDGSVVVWNRCPEQP